MGLFAGARLHFHAEIFFHQGTIGRLTQPVIFLPQNWRWARAVHASVLAIFPMFRLLAMASNMAVYA
ncbi:MAG: hypothetical protein LIP28_07550, partial [Deltaproteobacteria bacterium]|nr:hypothetical protein [Deltaproteobacteria bacterium]